MASCSDEDWDKDMAEIRSLSSDDLRETRPNRWRGPASTWRSLTTDERGTAQSLDLLRNQDLALHLYCAFALRKTLGDSAGEEETGEPGGEGLDEHASAKQEYGDSGASGRQRRQQASSACRRRWQVPRAWTAWPVPADEVPTADFMGRRRGADAAAAAAATRGGRRRASGARMAVDTTGFAVKREEGGEEEDSEESEEGRGVEVKAEEHLHPLPMELPLSDEQRLDETLPSRGLEDEIAAAMLRLARGRFKGRKRRWAEIEREEEEEERLLKKEKGKEAVRGSGEGGEESQAGGAGESDGEREGDEEAESSRATSDPTSGESAMDVDGATPGKPPHHRAPRPPSPSYVPVPSADDALSYTLLAPLARRVVTRLDATLAVLHHMRAAGIHVPPPARSVATTHQDEAGEYNRRPRRQGSVSLPLRPRRGFASEGDRLGSEMGSGEGGVSGAGSASEYGEGSGGSGGEESEREPAKPKRVRRNRSKSGVRGRPPAPKLPLPGESEREMLVRLARERKKRIPVFESDEEVGEEGGEVATKGRARLRGGIGGAESSMEDEDSDEEEEDEEEDSAEAARPSKRLPGRQGGKHSAGEAGLSARDRFRAVRRLKQQRAAGATGEGSGDSDNAASDGPPPPPRRRRFSAASVERSASASASAASTTLGGFIATDTEGSEPDGAGGPYDAARPGEDGGGGGGGGGGVSAEALRRWAPRGWREVLGAAALAGFPPDALRRAAARCAGLFGAPVELMVLGEGGADGSAVWRVGVDEGGTAATAEEEWERDEAERARKQADALGLRQRRVLHRRLPMLYGGAHATPAEAAVKQADTDTGGDDGDAAVASDSSRVPTPPRIRSFSRKTTVGVLYCTEAGCPRRARGFRTNGALARHLRVVHGVAAGARKAGGGGSEPMKEGGGEDNVVEVDVDGADEMYGGVHVDGFLQPIRVRPGWRGKDKVPKKKKRKERITRERTEEMETE